jgi:hypothetical protein
MVDDGLRLAALHKTLREAMQLARFFTFETHMIERLLIDGSHPHRRLPTRTKFRYSFLANHSLLIEFCRLRPSRTTEAIRSSFTHRAD